MRWQEYYLWTLAIEETEGHFPSWLVDDVDKHARGYLRYAAEYSLHHKYALRPNTSWRLLKEWIDDYVFRRPWNKGWMYAVGYYAVKDLTSLRDLTYCDWCVEAWKHNKPLRYPTFHEWRKASEQVSDEILDQLEMRDDRREMIKQMRCVRPRTLQMAVDKYVAWKAFAHWARVPLEEFSQLPDVVERELQIRCPGFLEEHGAARQNPRIFDSLMYWIEDHHFHRAKEQGWFDALLYEVELHPRHARAQDYWIDWENGWTRIGRPGYPSLESWTAALDKFTFEPEA
ncbi:MAG: hypothetical protein ACRD2P_00840 [Terriglobia bacterium]